MTRNQPNRAREHPTSITTVVTFEGNLAQDAASYETTNTGTHVTELVVLVNRRRQDAEGEWGDATPTRHRVKVFGALADRAGRLERGTTVLVHGRVETDVWPDKDTGANRYADTVLASAIGTSIRFVDPVGSNS